MVGLLIPFVGLLAVQIIAVVIYLIKNPITWSDVTSIPVIIRDFISRIFLTECNELTWCGKFLICTAIISLLFGIIIKLINFYKSCRIDMYEKTREKRKEK